ncbi:MAG: Bug family tripartite tricarboxylate transporter substrate binding protein [Burkholderiales bacterium]
MTYAIAEYPDRPIRFIVPSAVGGAADINARLLAAELTKLVGQQIVVDNRPGAAGSIGMELIARAFPDGYTIGYGTSAALAINRTLLAQLPYDPDKDFQMVALMGYQPNLLAVALSLPVKSVQELIVYAKNNPGKLSYGSSGSGTPSHLGMEMFKYMTGTQIVHVPYKAAQQAIAEMIAGQVHLLFDNFGSIVPHVKGGRIRGLGVTSKKRSSALPELPTLDEAGVPGFELTAWGGVVVPAGVRKPTVAKLNAEINRGLASPSLKEKVSLFGYEVAGGTPEHFTEHVKQEAAKWAAVIKRSGAKFD